MNNIRTRELLDNLITEHRVAKLKHLICNRKQYHQVKHV